MSRFLVYVFIAAFLILNIGSGCARKQEPSAGMESSGEPDIGQKVLQFELTAYTDRGVKNWDVRGESANIVDEVVDLTNIIATTYREETSVTLESEKGSYDRLTNTVHLEKNVVVTTEDGGRLRTESLYWDSKNNIVTTGAFVEIEREEVRLWSRGAKAEPELKKAQFEKDVRIEMYDGSTVITCDGPLDIDYENNIAIFYNNVKIDDGKGLVTSDTLDAFLNPETKEIRKAIARGNVKITRDDNHSHCEEAIYLAEERRVILTGRPRIVIYPDEEFKAPFFEVPNEQR